MAKLEWSLPQFPYYRLPLGSESPVAPPPVATNTVSCKASLLDQRQSPRRRGLVNAKGLGQLRSCQMRDRIEKLQRRVLRGREAAVGEHVLVEYCRSSGGLPKSCAITGERFQFH
jgi:hypothetical protein